MEKNPAAHRRGRHPDPFGIERKDGNDHPEADQIEKDDEKEREHDRGVAAGQTVTKIAA